MAKHEAGPELDARVAVEVLGRGVAPYSTDIAAAWEVVEHLWTHFWPRGSGGPRLECHIHPDFDGWHCNICIEAIGLIEASAVASTAPLAICRAALAAVEKEKTP